MKDEMIMACARCGRTDDYLVPWNAGHLCGTCLRQTYAAYEQATRPGGKVIPFRRRR